jgi:hypothetical protein
MNCRKGGEAKLSPTYRVALRAYNINGLEVGGAALTRVSSTLEAGIDPAVRRAVDGTAKGGDIQVY